MSSLNRAILDSQAMCEGVCDLPVLDSAQVKAVVERQYEAFVSDLELLTNIDSGTGDAAGSARIAAILEERVTGLGGTAERRANDRGTHLIARFKGEGRLRVLLSPHTDTVFEAGEAARRPFRVDERQLAYGPGVGDCKASVVQMVYLVKALRELGVRDFGELVVYFDAEEEGGSPDEERILRELAAQVDLALIVDTARPGWGIVTQRKGSATYDLRVWGVSGHAGNAPQAGASAVVELAHLITYLHGLASPLPGHPADFTPEALAARGQHDHGQFIPEISINVGVIGTPNRRRNRIPDEAYAQVEVRAFRLADLERLDRDLRARAGRPVVPGTRVTVEGGLKVGPMEKTPAAAQVIERYRNIVRREYGAEVVEWAAGGVTVGNRTAEFVPTVDALGVEADPVVEHTDREYVDLASFVPRTVALVHLIAELAQG